MKTIANKILTVLLFTLLFTACFSVFSNAAETIKLQIDSTEMLADSEIITIDAPPVIIDGRTLLPVRAVVEEMSGEVSWNSQSRQATLTNRGNTIVLTINSSEALQNGEAQTLDATPVIIDGRTFLPIRFIAESFGYNVDWNADTKEITISSNSETDETATEATTEQTTAVESEQTEDNGNILVAYFSATGNTKQIAEYISDGLDAYLYEITPQELYTDDDLNYNDDNSRTTKEMNDSSVRPAISGTVENWDRYDTVFIGYPIWWSEAPRIINTFLESYDFSGKTIVPFCTSGGSGIDNSTSKLKEEYPSANWLNGKRFGKNASKSEVLELINSIN